MKVSVIQADIDRGGATIETCMVATALNRQISETEVTVGISTALYRVNNVAYEAKLPKEVQEKILAYHLDRESIQPFEFEIEFKPRKTVDKSN